MLNKTMLNKTMVNKIMIKKILPTASLIMVLFGLSLISAPGHAKEFYKWIDDEGVTHYSVRPPADAEVKTEALTIKTPDTDTASPASASETETASGAEEQALSGRAALSPEDLAKLQQEEQANCDKARKNLYTLKNRTRIISPDEKTGEKRYLNDEERKKWTAESQKVVDEFCK